MIELTRNIRLVYACDFDCDRVNVKLCDCDCDSLCVCVALFEKQTGETILDLNICWSPKETLNAFPKIQRNVFESQTTEWRDTSQRSQQK